jgi:hypothetical protein
MDAEKAAAYAKQIKKALRDVEASLQVGELYACFLSDRKPADLLAKLSDARLASLVDFAGWMPNRLEEERLRRAPGKPDPEPLDVG